MKKMHFSPTPIGPVRHMVTVTRADIRPFLPIGRGKRRRLARIQTPDDCAIRAAVNRQWPGANPLVYYHYLQFGPVLVPLPRVARRWIARAEYPKLPGILQPFRFFITFTALKPKPYGH